MGELGNAGCDACVGWPVPTSVHTRAFPLLVLSLTARPNACAETSRPVSTAQARDAEAGNEHLPGPVAAAGHPGCFLLLDASADTLLSPRSKACGIATVPASTFKIPHALIALETGVVVDPEARMAWDGSAQPIDAWERDHDLRTAIHESVVWYFQRTARAIGRERMQAHLRAFDYGNANVSGAIDRFWLNEGSLRIDGDQALRFLDDLYRDRLPIAPEHVSTVRALLVRPLSSFAGRMPEGTVLPDVHPLMVLSAKTGTGAHGDERVTWWVGHVACPDRAWVFVSRVLDRGEDDPISPAVVHGVRALDGTGVLRCMQDR